MYKQNKNILMTQPSNVPSLEVYSLAASEPNKPRNCLWSAEWVPGGGPEQRESEKTVLFLQIIILLISYIIIFY
jgi:hypothetical protein